jgi:hypothetical protein
MLLLLSQPFEGGHFRTCYVTMRCLAVQLFAAIAIALADDFLPPGTPARMKWKPPTVGVAFESRKQQLINPYEGE